MNDPLESKPPEPAEDGGIRPRSTGWGDRQWPLLGLLWVAGLYLGYAGFARHAAALGEEASFLDLFYKTLQLIPMDSGAVPHPVSWELEVARLLLPIVAAYTAIKALANIFRQQIELFSLGFYRNHIVICGLSRKGFLLVEGFRHRGRGVVVIEHDEHNDWLEACRAMGAVVLLGDATDPTLLHKAGLPRAQCVIAVCNDDGINAEVAVRARALSTGRDANPLRCVIHLVDPQLVELLRLHEGELKKVASFKQELFNVYDMGARILVREHPLAAVDGSAPHLLIIGLGHLGESLVARAAREWHKLRPDDGRLRFSIVDQEASSRIESLKALHPQVAEACELTPFQINVYSPEFQRGDFLSGAGKLPDIVYVCLDSDSLGLHAGLVLSRLLHERNSPIVVRMAEKGGLATLLQEDGPGNNQYSNLTAFPLLDRTCTPDILLAEDTVTSHYDNSN
jgi:hypothetical protein